MKLAIMSDLHVDRNYLTEEDLRQLIQVLKEENVTALHLAGDTSNSPTQTCAIAAKFSNAGIETTFNFGNHELGEIDDPKQMEDYPDPHFLNLKGRSLSESTTLVGFNGWYDYGFLPGSTTAENEKRKELYLYDRAILRGGKDPMIMDQLLARLKPLLDELSKKKQTVLFATHFVPRPEFILWRSGGSKRWNLLNAFLGSPRLGELLAHYPNITDVTFGHTHHRFPPTKIGSITYHCRPFGYTMEWRLTYRFLIENQLLKPEEFRPRTIKTAVRENREAFDRFKTQHLAEEYRESLSLFSVE